ncbi:cell envelope integrity EipB family protein [Methylocapsa sp. S129]|uniref:cell envelope integrity EipB family protein n=1 Tax=Methylocapsa sp. S129 TaxID=1641869 RepID=UPI00131D9D4B|nr:cell envelope integrity EipB family protein [Methylocapsa sp. S129]
MKLRLAMAAFALATSLGAARADAVMPLAAHRAAYQISLAKGNGSQAPVSASGLIAYEFHGSSCEGYAATFRQVTELQRGEGAPISSDTKAVTFEDGQAKTLRFRIDTSLSDNAQTPIDGSATRSDAGDISVNLTQPKEETLALGKDILFPTQHIARIIETAKSGGSVLEARVFDGSDTGEKIFDTLTVVGKEATAPGADADAADSLKALRRWPVAISYFDAAKKDSAPEYVLSFDLYENGVSGSLKLDYGSFSLAAQLTKLELLPAAPCAK